MCSKCGDEYIKSMFSKPKETKPVVQEDLDLSVIETTEQLLSFLTGMHQPVEEDKRRCKCGWKEDDFASTGRFGCPKCYEVFFDKVEKIVLPYHNGNEHIGKRPPHSIARELMKDPIEHLKLLKIRLAHAIEHEHYELAATIKKELDSVTEKP